MAVKVSDAGLLKIKTVGLAAAFIVLLIIVADQLEKKGVKKPLW